MPEGFIDSPEMEASVTAIQISLDAAFKKALYVGYKYNQPSKFVEALELLTNVNDYLASLSSKLTMAHTINMALNTRHIENMELLKSHLQILPIEQSIPYKEVIKRHDTIVATIRLSQDCLLSVPEIYGKLVTNAIDLLIQHGPQYNGPMPPEIFHYIADPLGKSSILPKFVNLGVRLLEVSWEDLETNSQKALEM